MNNVKEYRVITTPTFEREVKKLLKRNPRVAKQIEQLLEFLLWAIGEKHTGDKKCSLRSVVYF